VRLKQLHFGAAILKENVTKQQYNGKATTSALFDQAVNHFLTISLTDVLYCCDIK
jgi:hypothetical protein